jgi:chromodomain-helicase-DNA-binding protein 1
MVMKEAAPKQQVENNAGKKPRPGGSAKINGSSSVPSSSVRTNGKSYR